MKTSAAGIIEIMFHEGVVLGPYKDSVGTWTYGVGHTAPAGAPDPSKMNHIGTEKEELQRAISVFERDLETYERRVNQAVKVPITQSQFDALVSFDLNTGGVFKARLTKLLNSGASTKDVGAAFFGWLRPPSIKGRRTDEKHLFETGDYRSDDPGISIQIYTVENAHPKPLKTMTFDELRPYFQRKLDYVSTGSLRDRNSGTINSLSALASLILKLIMRLFGK